MYLNQPYSQSEKLRTETSLTNSQTLFVLKPALQTVRDTVCSETSLTNSQTVCILSIMCGRLQSIKCVFWSSGSFPRVFVCATSVGWGPSYQGDHVLVMATNEGWVLTSG